MDPNQPAVTLANAEGIATLTLCAPARANALDPAMLAQLAGHLQGLDPQVRVVLLRGAGEQHFSAGYDLPALVAELEQGPSVNDYKNHPLELALRALEACPVPTVAVIQGHAYGSGCELALACDLRLAADEARLCMPPAKLGILYSATGLRRLLQLVGPSLAKELIYTAEPVDAARALRLGLVNHVHPKAELEARVRELAQRIARNDALSIRYTKRLFDQVLGPPPLAEQTLDEVAGWREECFQRPELRERARRLLDRKL